MLHLYENMKLRKRGRLKLVLAYCRSDDIIIIYASGITVAILVLLQMYFNPCCFYFELTVNAKINHSHKVTNGNVSLSVSYSINTRTKHQTCWDISQT